MLLSNTHFIVHKKFSFILKHNQIIFISMIILKKKIFTLKIKWKKNISNYNFMLDFSSAWSGLKMLCFRRKHNICYHKIAERKVKNKSFFSCHGKKIFAGVLFSFFFHIREKSLSNKTVNKASWWCVVSSEPDSRALKCDKKNDEWAWIIGSSSFSTLHSSLFTEANSSHGILQQGFWRLHEWEREM